MTLDGDVRLARPGGTDLAFAGVSWADESFVSSIYYGYRVTYWLPGEPNWGLVLDFTHAKMYADLSETVPVCGTRDGTPVSGGEPLSDTFQGLSFSHSHNWLSFNAFYRWFPKGARDSTFAGRLQPYGGLGIGVPVPHVEVTIEGSATDEYQLAGPATQLLAGLNADIINRLGLSLEYKLSYARLNGDLTGGGTIEVRPWTNQFVFGATFSLAPTR